MSWGYQTPGKGSALFMKSGLVGSWTVWILAGLCYEGWRASRKSCCQSSRLSAACVAWSQRDIIILFDTCVSFMMSRRALIDSHNKAATQSECCNCVHLRCLSVSESACDLPRYTKLTRSQKSQADTHLQQFSVNHQLFPQRRKSYVLRAVRSTEYKVTIYSDLLKNEVWKKIFTPVRGIEPRAGRWELRTTYVDHYTMPDVQVDEILIIHEIN